MAFEWWPKTQYRRQSEDKITDLFTMKKQGRINREPVRLYVLITIARLQII